MGQWQAILIQHTINFCCFSPTSIDISFVCLHKARCESSISPPFIQIPFVIFSFVYSIFRIRSRLQRRNDDDYQQYRWQEYFIRWTRRGSHRQHIEIIGRGDFTKTRWKWKWTDVCEYINTIQTKSLNKCVVYLFICLNIHKIYNNKTCWSNVWNLSNALTSDSLFFYHIFPKCK